MSTAHTFLKHLAGGRRDQPDPRDHPFIASHARHGMPDRVDLRGQCPPVYNQGKIASCTACAIAGAIEFSRMKHGQAPQFTPSRLFIYYNERALKGTQANDAGASTRDGIKVVSTHGAPPEHLWPYDDTPATSPGGPFPPGARAAQKPPQPVYSTAERFEVLKYQRLRNDLTAMKSCLAQGYPFTIGIVLYPSFVGPDHRQPALALLPKAGEQPVGEHIVLAVGYDDTSNWLICRNSWGAEQGDRGYFYLPYAYASERELIGDLWTLRTIEH